MDHVSPLIPHRRSGGAAEAKLQITSYMSAQKYDIDSLGSPTRLDGPQGSSTGGADSSCYSHEAWQRRTIVTTNVELALQGKTFKYRDKVIGCADHLAVPLPLGFCDTDDRT